MEGTVLFDGSSSFPTSINNGVKQGCVLAPILFGIFFSLLLSFAFSVSEDRVFLLTRSDGKLFNLSRLRAKTKVRQLLFREMLFADDAALASHIKEGLQRLINRLAHACKEFGLTVSLKNTNVTGQDVSEVPSISIGYYTLEVVEDFTYPGSTISSNQLDCPKECGRTTRWPTPVCWAPYSTTRTSPQQLPSALPATYLVYMGRTECPRRISSSGRTLQACSRCSPKDAYAGSAMSGAWRMDAL